MKNISEFALESQQSLFNREKKINNIEIARSINSLASNFYADLNLMFSPKFVEESDEGKFICKYIECDTKPSADEYKRMKNGLNIGNIQLNTALQNSLDAYQKSIEKWLRKDGHGDFQ